MRTVLKSRLRLSGLNRLALLIAAVLLTSGLASAYYHFIYFSSRQGPFLPYPVRFDLGSIPGKTVYYFISDDGPTKFAAGDTFVSVVSQIRAAAEVWNGVATSDLRLQFGGITAAGTQQVGPGIDVTFDDDIDPSLIALGGVKTIADLSYLQGGFIPIVRSVLRLRKDLSTNDPAFSDKFFLTLVHEFGHTIGLQHTFTSSVMSTQITRSTSKARPLGGDDVAGVSALYGSSLFATTTGSISGRVTFSNGLSTVNLASVVAITPHGDAVSALTNPDGTYKISGLAPGQYTLYVHPLPPALPGEATPANINLPLDITNTAFGVSGAFDTVFYPGTRDWSQASQVGVSVGALTDNVNFSVAPRTGSAISSVELFGYYGDVGVRGPRFVQNNPASIVVRGPGLVVNGRMAAGASVSLLGETGIYANSLQLNTDAKSLFFYVTNAGTLGARHLVFSLNNDVYVLPSAMNVVQSKAPSVAALTPALDDSGNRAVIVSGASLSAGTRVWFDGAAATISRVNPEGSLLVTPPPANGNYTAHVVALNADGQTSAFLLGSTPPPPFSYDAMATPAISVSPSSLAAGTDSMVEITGFNTNFVEGQTVVGFGSSDIVVNKSWVVSPTKLLLNVSVNPYAPYTSTTLTVASGLLLVSQPLSFQITPASSRQITLRAPVLNQATNLAGVPAGGTAVVNGVNLPASSTGLVLTVAGQQTTVVSNGGSLAFQVPQGLTPGPAVVRLTTPQGDAVPPILMQIDGPPPVITSANTESSGAVDATRPAKGGEVVTLVVSFLSDGVTPLNTATVRVSVGGVDQPGVNVVQVNPLGGSQVQFTLGTNIVPGVQPVVLTVDTRASSAFNLAIR